MATQRTRTASKALIPSLSDPVGKLNGLGGMTVKKLIDLGNQVREARSAILADVPMASASTGEAQHSSPPGGSPCHRSLFHLICLRVLQTALSHARLAGADTCTPKQRGVRTALRPDVARSGGIEGAL